MENIMELLTPSPQKAQIKKDGRYQKSGKAGPACRYIWSV